MKYTAKQTVANSGVIFVQKVVNEHGSIFRPVHQETDLGVDGFIELVKAEESSCRLVAVQIKSGDSYLSPKGDEFLIDVDQRHLNYWLNFMVPVIIVAYSPSKDVAAWTSVRDYVEYERYHDRLTVTQIRIPFYEKFDAEALSKNVAGLAHVRADERLLIRCANKCLSQHTQERHNGFQILSQHPDSRRLKITCLLARRLLMDENEQTAKDALHILGFGVGRQRWSWNPNNQEEAGESSFAAQTCRDLTNAEIRRLVELCDDEGFRGPQGLGERLFDVLCCCFDTAERVLDDVACDKSQPMQRRANALYMLFECDDDAIEEIYKNPRENDRVRDVIDWMFTPSSAAPPSSENTHFDQKKDMLCSGEAAHSPPRT